MQIAIAVLIAQPDGWHEMPPGDLANARNRVQSAWSGIGFERFDDEVW